MATKLNPEQRTLRAKVAAHTRWAQEDPRPTMSVVRDGFHKRFLDEVDPDRVLPEAERERRAQCALMAHMTRLAYLSAKARAGRKASA